MKTEEWIKERIVWLRRLPKDRYLKEEVRYDLCLVCKKKMPQYSQTAHPHKVIPCGLEQTYEDDIITILEQVLE